MKYRNHHLTTVEIVYNTITFIAAVITVVVFTIYAKRALNELQVSEREVSTAGNHGTFEMEKLPLERPKQLDGISPSLHNL